MQGSKKLLRVLMCNSTGNKPFLASAATVGSNPGANKKQRLIITLEPHVPLSLAIFERLM
jgi:hypothetical protein